MQLKGDLHEEPVADADAGVTWASGPVRWKLLGAQVLAAAIGVAFVAIANAAASQGTPGTQPLWWLGVLAIFAPAAATLLFGEVSRTEAVVILLVAGIALYGVKLVYAPGMFWEFDELLHYRTVDNLLTTRHLFGQNSLLPVSPYYPGLEAVTAAIVQLTGLSIIQSGLVLIGVARVLTVTSLFLLLERIAKPSRLAAPAALLYMASPAFLYFDSQFAYESLALALSMVCLFVLRAAQTESGPRRQGLNAVGAILLLSVVVTHHITSFILCGTLILWVLIELYGSLRARARTKSAEQPDVPGGTRLAYLSDLPGSVWVPLLGVLFALAWLVNIAARTISYLWPQLMSGLTELARVIRLEETGRTLFESNGGYNAPILERAVGVGSVVIILVFGALGMKYLWERRDSNVLARSLALGSLAYPATLVLRFTKSGWEIGSRATAFVYLPLAFTIAIGIEPLIARRVRHDALRVVAIVLAASLIFAGGIVAVTSPVTRQPAPYDPGVAWVPYDAESLADANWAATVLGPGHRFAADSAGGALIGSIGRQVLVTSGDGVSVSKLFLSPEFDTRDRQIVKNGRIEYALVDRRISGAQPLKGFIYEKWEQLVQGYGSSVSSDTVNKFSVLRDASKVFDSGDIEFFELHRLTND